MVGIIFLVYVNVKIQQLKPKPDFNDDENNKKPSIYNINTSNIELSQDDVNINKDIDPNREKQIAAYTEIGLSTDKWKEDYSSYVERIHKVRSKLVLQLTHTSCPYYNVHPSTNHFPFQYFSYSIKVDFRNLISLHFTLLKHLCTLMKTYFNITIQDNKKTSLIRARSQPPVQFGGPGVNFFLRIGAIGK